MDFDPATHTVILRLEPKEASVWITEAPAGPLSTWHYWVAPIDADCSSAVRMALAAAKGITESWPETAQNP